MSTFCAIIGGALLVVVGILVAVANTAIQEEARLRALAVACQRDLDGRRAAAASALAIFNRDCCPRCGSAPRTMPC